MYFMNVFLQIVVAILEGKHIYRKTKNDLRLKTDFETYISSCLLLNYLQTPKTSSFCEKLSYIVLLTDFFASPPDLFVKIPMSSKRQNILGWFMVFISNE